MRENLSSGAFRRHVGESSAGFFSHRSFVQHQERYDHQAVLLSVSYKIRHSIRRFSQRSLKNTLFCCRDVGMGSSSCEHQISLFLEEHHLC